MPIQLFGGPFSGPPNSFGAKNATFWSLVIGNLLVIVVAFPVIVVALSVIGDLSVISDLPVIGNVLVIVVAIPVISDLPVIVLYFRSLAIF